MIFNLLNAVSMITIIFVSCTEKTQKGETQEADTIPVMNSGSFNTNDSIPLKFSCDHPGQSNPELVWKNLDTNSLSYVLIMDDPDAIPVAGKIWYHWILYDIPNNVHRIEAGVMRQKNLPPGTGKGRNSWGDTAYGGPCPPKGQLHHYYFRLYGLNIQNSGILSSTPPEQVYDKIRNHIIDSAILMGTFKH